MTRHQSQNEQFSSGDETERTNKKIAENRQIFSVQFEIVDTLMQSL